MCCQSLALPTRQRTRPLGQGFANFAHHQPVTVNKYLAVHYLKPEGPYSIQFTKLQIEMATYLLDCCGETADHPGLDQPYTISSGEYNKIKRDISSTSRSIFYTWLYMLLMIIALLLTILSVRQLERKVAIVAAYQKPVSKYGMHGILRLHALICAIFM